MEYIQNDINDKFSRVSIRLRALKIGKWDVLKSMINYWNGKLRAKNIANDSTNN